MAWKIIWCQFQSVLSSIRELEAGVNNKDPGAAITNSEGQEVVIGKDQAVSVEEFREATMMHLLKNFNPSTKKLTSSRAISNWSSRAWTSKSPKCQPWWTKWIRSWRVKLPRRISKTNLSPSSRLSSWMFHSPKRSQMRSSGSDRKASLSRKRKRANSRELSSANLNTSDYRLLK